MSSYSHIPISKNWQNQWFLTKSAFLPNGIFGGKILWSLPISSNLLQQLRHGLSNKHQRITAALLRVINSRQGVSTWFHGFGQIIMSVHNRWMFFPVTFLLCWFQYCVIFCIFQCISVQSTSIFVSNNWGLRSHTPTGSLASPDPLIFPH